MRTLRARIVHISDLHFGPYLDKQLKNQLLTRIGELRPNYLVISGDLVDNPTPWGLRKARRFVDDMVAAGGMESNRVLVTAGNHDYKFQGNMGVRRLTRIPFQVNFRSRTYRKGRWRRWLEYLELMLNALWPWGRLMRNQLVFLDGEADDLVLVGFDSTPLFEAFAKGEISGNQLAALFEPPINPDHWNRNLRIVAVHHHPLPIPFVPVTTATRVSESLMILQNAGTFLRQLGEAGVDLVLHGHEHFSGFSRIGFDIPGHGRHEIGVLAAGSATRMHNDEAKGNEFNVIDLFDDETVQIRRWYHSPGIPSLGGSNTFDLFNLDDVRARRTLRAMREMKRKADRLTRKVTLTPNGFSEVVDRVDGCRVTCESGLGEIRICLDSTAPHYVRNLRLDHRIGDPDFLALDVGAGPSPRCVHARLHFGGDRFPGEAPFNYGYRYRLMNGHTTNQAEFQRRYWMQEDAWEFASLECSGAVEALEIVVEFPYDGSMETPVQVGAEARYEPDSPKIADIVPSRRHDAESNRIATFLKREGRTLSLIVPDPIPGFVYRVRWNYELYSEPGAKAFKEYDSLVKATLQNLITRPHDPTLPEQRKVTEILDLLRMDVEQRYPAHDPKEQLDVTLAVFDPADSHLHFVGMSWPTQPGICDLRLHPGEGCAGFTFEKMRVLLYNSEADSNSYYLRPDELNDQGHSGPFTSMHRALITLPCVIDGMPFGVISIGSAHRFSRLLHVFELDEQKMQAEAQFLCGLATVATRLLVALTEKEFKGVD